MKKLPKTLEIRDYDFHWDAADNVWAATDRSGDLDELKIDYDGDGGWGCHLTKYPYTGYGSGSNPHSAFDEAAQDLVMQARQALNAICCALGERP